jgi:hypothetical protein
VNWESPEAIAFLVQLWKDASLSASTIARELGKHFGFTLTRNAVIGKAHRLGLEPRNKIVRNDGVVQRVPERHTQLIKAKPKPLRRPAAAVAPVDGISLIELQYWQCRWPLGDDPCTQKYCGAQISQRSYCAKHAAIAFHSSGRSSA